MVKTHRKTGLKYLCQTKRDPFKYKGSGKYWKLHLSKYGRDIDTVILHECDTYEEVKSLGIHYSTLWNVESSEEWANLKPEEGEGGFGCPGYKHPDNVKKYLGDIRRGIPLPPSHAASVRAANASRVGKSWGSHTEEAKNSIRNQSHSEEYLTFLKESRVGNGNPMADKTIHKFINDDGRIEECTRSDLRIKYNLNKNHMRTIINASGVSHGWRLYK
jgi:hypothetical protein